MNTYEELKQLAKKAKENCEKNQRLELEEYYTHVIHSIKKGLELCSVRKDIINYNEFCKYEIPSGPNQQDIIDNIFLFFMSKGFPKKILTTSCVRENNSIKYYLVIDL